MIIGSAAYFQVCKCRRHGRIVTTSGILGPECASKTEALCAMEKGLALGMIEQIEVPGLTQLIEQSSLPSQDESVSPVAWFTVSLINLARFEAYDEAIAERLGEHLPRGEAQKDWVM